jgi:hypothetical protein
VVVGRFAGIAVVAYRPGSLAVQSAFFEKQSLVLDVIAAYREPVNIVGDSISGWIVPTVSTRGTYTTS